MDLNFQTFMADLRAEEAAPPWSVGMALSLVVAYFALRVVALAVLSFLLDADAAAAGIVSPLAVNAAGVLAGAAILAVIWLALRARAESLVHALRLDALNAPLLLLILFALGAAIVVDFVPLLAQTLGLPPQFAGLTAAGPEAWAAALLFTLLIGPLAEGVLLQGVLYPALAAGGHNLRAIAITGLALAALRAADDPADPVLWITAFLTGVVLTGVRAHRQSTRAALVTGIMFGVFILFKALRLFLYDVGF